MIYIFVLLLLVVLSIHYDINGETRYRNFWFNGFLVFFILLAGLRWRLCMDTPNYIYNFYHEYPTLSDFSWRDYSFGKDPLFALLNSIVKSAGGRFYIVQIIQAAFVNVLALHYIKKHCTYCFTALLFYYVLCYLGYSMEIMRASMSIALSLYANDYFLERKWIKAYGLLLVGCLFHAQTIVLLILPVLFFLRLNKRGITILVSALFIGHIIQVSTADYIVLFEGNETITNKAAGYADSEQYGTQGGNLNFFIVNIFPYLLYGMVSLWYLKRKKKGSELLKLEPFVMVGFFFIVMQMSMQIMYRFVDYYRIYFLMIMSDVFVTWIRNTTKLSKGLAYARTLLLFSPMFVFNQFYLIKNYYVIYPYSSVIEKSIDEKRERYYIQSDRPKANKNEY